MHGLLYVSREYLDKENLLNSFDNLK
jgi:hypothetical protein